MSGLASGLLHPLMVPAHVLALVALGLCIDLQARAARIAAGAGFALGVAGGLAAIAFAARPTSAIDLLLTATLLSGALAAAVLPLPSLVSALLAGLTGAALGMDSPPQAISLTVATMTLIGTGIGACLIFVVATVAAGLLRGLWKGIPLRILGSWCAASALLVLALRFARGLMFE